MDYVFDAGINKIFDVDTFALLGINWRTGSFQMNATDSWGSPSVDESFTVANEISSTVTGISEDTLTDSTLTLNINRLAKQNRPMYLKMTSGTASGNVYNIISNSVTTIKVSEASLSTDGVSSSDSYVVFGGRVSKSITSASYRYVRLVIDAQHTADDYYKTGKLLFGLKVQLSKHYNIGFREPTTSNISSNMSRAGQKFTTKKGESRKRLSLNFTRKTSAFFNEIESLMESIDWGNTPFVFIQDGDNIQDFMLMRIEGGSPKENIAKDIFSTTLEFIEEL